MKRGEEVQLRLERFAFEGKTVARVDGLVAFVSGGVAGDEVRARVTKVKKQFVEAETLEVLKPSSKRTEPRCKHFGTCGGCKWQHVDYQAQLDFKRQHVIDALERIGGFKGVAVKPTLASPDIYHYRNKMEFSFGQRWLSREELQAKENGGTFNEQELFALGLHIPKRFDRVLDLDECWLQSETSYKIVNAVRRFCHEHSLPIYSTDTHTGFLRNLVIREGKRTGDLMANLVTSEERPEIMVALRDRLLGEFPGITTVINNITDRKSQVAIGDTETVYHGPGYITERIGKRTYNISANSFFQTNTSQAENLYEAARRMARLKPSDIVFDLYSGTGTIALHIADDVAQVVGIESVPSATEDAERNAKLNGVDNCRFILGDLKDTLIQGTTLFENQQRPNVVITDPPRVGMHEKVIDELQRLSPERIVYVSCNPATQARDLKLLYESGNYEIAEVLPVDMFPHTYHVESVVMLQHLE